MKKRKRFYVWLLPLLCGTCSYVHRTYPGDENAMWLISSAPGVWLNPLVFLGKPSKAILPVYIALGLAAFMALIGLAMDRFHIRKTLWIIVFPVCAFIVFALSILSFPSIERALNKNGSWWAYICFSCNMGIYLAIILSCIVTVIVRGWYKIKGKRQ